MKELLLGEYKLKCKGGEDSKLFLLYDSRVVIQIKIPATIYKNKIMKKKKEGGQYRWKRKVFQTKKLI